MRITEREGDLFEYTEDATPGAPRFIGHGVNMMGSMGAGIAYQFAKLWPSLEEDYQRHCYAHTVQDLSGTAHLFWPTPTVGVFSLFTQQNPGPDARLRWVADSIKHAGRYLWLNKYPQELAVPRVGCGIGGLEWETVRDLLRRTPSNLHLIVYSL